MEFHNLDLLVSTIRDRGFKSICIQSKDTNQSLAVCDHLQELFKSDSTVKFYILADILSGSCCLDVVATKRFQTDCLVYIGDGCYFELDVPVYVFYLYFKIPVQLEPIIAKVDWLCKSLDFESVLCVYSSSFYHILNEVATRFRGNNKRFYFTGLNCCQDNADTANSVGDKTLMVCNRPVYEHNTDNSIFNYSSNNSTVPSNLYSSNSTKLKKLEGNSLLVLYIGDSKDDSTAKLIGLSVSYKHIYQIAVPKDESQVKTGSDSDSVASKDSKYHSEDLTDLCTSHLMKRYSMVEKAQKASNFGVIVLTKSFKGGTRLRQLIQRLLLLKEKSFGLFSVNHLTEAKLLNFSKVDLWVLLSCNFTPLSLSRELEKMLIYPFELLVALGVLDWGSYVFSYADLSKVLERYIATLECSDGMKDLTIDSALVEGDENEGVGPNLQLNRLQNMEIRERFETLYENISTNENRTFRGLEPEFKAEVRVVKGSKGTASSYEHEGQYL